MVEGTEHRFLVVDDDPTVQRALQRVVCRHGEAVAARTFQQAAALLDDRSAWTAFFFDIQLPDGSGLDLLALARTNHPITPAMVLTGSNEDAAANAAYDLRADYVIKPVVTKRIEHFLEDAISLDFRLASALRAWATRYGLSEAEKDLLGRTALGESKSAIAGARATSKETIKTQVATLLGKTGDDSLLVAAARFLRDVARA
jgi:DNA-binding NarL/FixJ family response regulator